MNRIILIGNGFDLAHGLKTSYNDFINDYWINTITDIQKITPRTPFENSEIKINRVPNLWLPEINFQNLMEGLERIKEGIQFKNRFLEIINKKKQIQNWVDIENEYYYLLKECFKNKNCDYDIRDLNEDFTAIQNLLEAYLRKVEESFKQNFGKERSNEFLKKSIASKVYSNFKLKDFTEAYINKKAEFEYQQIKEDIKALDSGDITMKDINEEKHALISIIDRSEPIKSIRQRLLYETASNYFNLQPSEILFLNFNYTFTEELYSNLTWFELQRDMIKNQVRGVIHIHGTTNDKDKNDVIFGFGDEIDEDYKSIENLNENIYLENIKSIKYLETDNYKKLLEFLNSGDYQIFVFGHSCGNSDRTLLSTLFEHKHCVSVKPFYHKKDEGADNYSDIVRNISRNFSNKAIMRDKVVNKEYCEPLT